MLNSALLWKSSCDNTLAVFAYDNDVLDAQYVLMQLAQFATVFESSDRIESLDIEEDVVDFLQNYCNLTEQECETLTYYAGNRTRGFTKRPGEII